MKITNAEYGKGRGQRKHRQFEVCIIYGIFTALDGLCEEDIYKNWFDNIVTTNPNALNECALVH